VAGPATDARPARVPPPPPAAPPTTGTSPPAHARSPARPGLALLAALLAGIAGAALYVRTLAPSVQGGDSGEFQFVAHILGIPHPPGYPLYAVAGKLWTLLVPVGEIAWRMNLMSAAFAAAALAALAWAGATAYRGGPAGVAAGLAAAAWLAVAPTWWSQATIASVRAPTGFFVAAVLAALATFAATRRPGALYAAAALYGLGLTHHISLYTLAPAVALFVLLHRPPIAALRRALLFGAAPLLLYAYLPIRSALGSEFDASHPTTLDAFVALVSARGFAGDMLFFNPLSPERLDLGRQIVLTNFDVLGVALAAAGAAVTLAWRPRWFALTGGIAAINLLISLSYRAPVIADYLIPTYVVMALWIGALAAAVARPLAVPVAACLALALLPASYAGSAWHGFDLSQDRADRRFLEQSFAEAAPGATVLTDWYHATILWYGQHALGQRRDLTVEYVSPDGAEVPWLRRAEAALTRGPAYTTALDSRIGERHHLQRVGPLYRVDAVPSADAVPADATAVGARFGDAVELAAYRLDQPVDGSDVALRLFWRARRPVPADYRQFVHLTDPTGRVWGQRDGTPGEGLYPTSRWRAGELVAERYDLTVAPTAPAGRLDVRVGLYETLPGPPGWRRLEARAADGSPLGDAPIIAGVTVQPLAVPPRPDADAPRGALERALGRLDRSVRGDALPSRAWIPFGKRALLTGWMVAPHDGGVRVRLEFLPIGRIPEDLAVFVHLVDAAGALVAQSDSVPVSGGLPTLRWAPWRPVRDTRTLAVSPGSYQVRVGMYVMSTGAHLPVLDDGLARAGQAEHVVLTELQVRP
jgi:hypothetical protein